MSGDWPQITYEQAEAAYQAGQKLHLGARHTHLGSRIYLVRPALRDGVVDDSTAGAIEAPVLWVTDERTLGDHGLLLFLDGRVVAK